MIKLKIGGIRPEVDKLIKDAAEHCQFYDPKFPEESQCSGYHAFKEMCLMKENICTFEEFENHKKADPQLKPAPIGFYLLTRIHPNARKRVIEIVNKLREIFSKGQAANVTVKKKS